MDEGTILVYCCPATSSLTSPPSQTKCAVYTDSVWLWRGGGVLNCAVDHNLQEFYTLFLTRFKTFKIASPPQTKMTSKDDIKGLVSLKFLRPCWTQLAMATLLSPYFLTFMEPRNWFQGMNSASLCSLAGRYDNTIPSRFLSVPSPHRLFKNSSSEVRVIY